jgi:hypothetical protein
MRSVKNLAMSMLLAGVLLTVAAAAASAANTPYETNYSSAYGAVHCVGKLIVNKTYPGNANEGGKEVEKCTSTEPSGKLTGYFSPGEEYTGYWESDYYATIGKFGVQPTSVLIKVSKSFKSFKVRSAIYPVAAS